MKDLIPFDLEKALAGEPVITRDGREVTELHLFKTSNSSNQPLVVCVDGCIENYNPDGSYSLAGTFGSSSDLFMKPKPVDVYLNVYEKWGQVSTPYSTVLGAKDCAGNTATSIVKISILNGEVISAETVHRY